MRKVLAVVSDLAFGLPLVAVALLGVRVLLQSRSLASLFFPSLCLVSLAIGFWRGGAAALAAWQTVALLSSSERLSDLTWTEQIALVRRHCDLVLDYYGGERGSRMLRKFIAWGLKGFRGAARLRSLVQSIASPMDVTRVLDQAMTIDPGDRLLATDVDDEPASCEAA